MYTDLTEPQLWDYRSTASEPADFDAFWAARIAEVEVHPITVSLTPVESVPTLSTWDVTFTGAGGAPIRAWYSVPAETSGLLPTVVQYVGYGGGRGHVLENLLWASAGFAHFVMDNRGQGSSHREGVTADPGPRQAGIPGQMTSDLLDPAGHFYARLFVDAVRAIDATLTLPGADRSRLAVVGGSQGGAMALAAGALSPIPRAVVSFVPFLCDIRRAVMITDELPYREVADYLRTHRRSAETALDVLDYFDGVHFAHRAHAPAWFSTSLMDPVCPPSTVFGAYHEYAAPKSMTVWPFNGHIGGGIEDEADAIRFLRARLSPA